MISIIVEDLRQSSRGGIRDGDGRDSALVGHMSSASPNMVAGRARQKSNLGGMVPPLPFLSLFLVAATLAALSSADTGLDTCITKQLTTVKTFASIDKLTVIAL